MYVKKLSAAMDAFPIPDNPDSFGNLLREQSKMIAEIEDLFVYVLALKIINEVFKPLNKMYK